MVSRNINDPPRSVKPMTEKIQISKSEINFQAGTKKSDKIQELIKR
jgi:hypothetical protein